MQKKIAITSNRISFQNSMELNSILEILMKNPYNEDVGIGFIKAEIFENILEGCLIKRTPTSLQEFDNQSGSFIQRNIFIFDEIFFFIDLQNNLLYSFNQASKLSIVKQALKNCISEKILFENLKISPQKIITDLLKNGFTYQITEIVINKFIYNKGVQGKYSAKILDYKVGQQLMEEYLSEIEKITIEVNSPEYELFTLTISNSCSISIKSNEEDFNSILNNIKKLIT